MMLSSYRFAAARAGAVSLLFASAVCSVVQAAQTWKLDPGFGTNGQVLTKFLHFPECNAVLVQPNGRILTVGSDTDPQDQHGKGVLAGYRKTGRPDSAFGTAGKLVFAIPNQNVTFNAAALQHDQRIVAVGSVTPGTNYFLFDPALVRFLPNGAVDTSFGSGGVVITPLGARRQFESVVIQPDRKIVAAGYGTANNTFAFAVVRYLPNGTLDSSFGTNGVVLSPFGIGATIVRSVALQPDRKLLICGDTSQGAAIVRLNADGSTDSGFGTNGVVLLPFGSRSTPWALGVQQDGKILVTGLTGVLGVGDTFLARLLSDGELDGSFGTAGIANGPTGGGLFLLLQKDGRSVVGGQTEHTGFVARFTTSGGPDPTFGPDGVITAAAPDGDFGLNTGALQKDGRILAGGYSSTMSGGEATLLLRYRP